MTVVATVVSEEQLTAAHMALALHVYIHIYRYDGIYIPLSLVLAHACILLHVHIYRYDGLRIPLSLVLAQHLLHVHIHTGTLATALHSDS